MEATDKDLGFFILEFYVQKKLSGGYGAKQ